MKYAIAVRNKGINFLMVNFSDKVPKKHVKINTGIK